MVWAELIQEVLWQLDIQDKEAKFDKRYKKENRVFKGKKIKVWVDVGRNKSETYEGFVLDTYKNIWTFKTETDVKSFSYSDILINSVVLSS